MKARQTVAHALALKIAATRIERTPMHRAPTPRSRVIGPIALWGLFLSVLLIPTLGRAQETTGRLVGRVTDAGTGNPLSGITVILQGQQGEDAALTDDGGEYTFVNVHVGSYVVRFYNANSSTKVERPDIDISAGATVRADAAIPSQAAVEETYVIKKKAPAVDVGSARLGMTIGEDYMQSIPTDRTFGDLILKAPGAFLESSGSVSIAGASGLENVYVMNGLNVTGMEMGDIMNGRSDASGGSNLSLDFVKELQINTGGYAAEFGGAMGGVINVVTKSGSNEIHGSAFTYWAPYWLSGEQKLVIKRNSALNGVDKPDYDTNFGFELGGPVIKNKLFFWVGFAPRLEKKHFFRDASALVDADQDGVADVDKNGRQVSTLLERTRTRELRQSYQYGGKIDYLVAPDHKLSIGLFGTPTASRHVRTLLIPGGEAINDPAWADQSLHKNNTDVNVTWSSQFLDRRLRLDASVGLHRETFSDESPNAALNAKNQFEWHNANLYDLEGLAACAPTPYTDTSGKAQSFNPCPVDAYNTGGYGQVKSYVGNRWAGDVKATALVNRNEIKFGIHGEYNTFDQTRYYSGPPGSRYLVDVQPNTSYVWNFFSLPKGTYPYQFAQDKTPLLAAPYYQDQLVANVKGVNVAYFVQDTVRPLPNLTIDLGVRLENQRLYDYRGDAFLNLYNIGPRLGVTYDPSNEGRSKVFTHYGRFFETIPMNLAARYFGGEGIAISGYDNASCKIPTLSWQGSSGNEKATCDAPQIGTFNAGANYPVQPNIKGQYHDEVVAGFRHALTDDLVVGIDVTHRWLGGVIEDGTVNGDSVLGNPGQVPSDTLNGMKKDIADRQKEIAAAAPNDPSLPGKKADLGQLQSKLDNLTGLGAEPKPERTYDAVTVSASKRLARNWMLNASYTYSRLIGNYNGLYDADNSYFAPNGSNAYDFPELVVNRRGPLANDRPHSGRVDGMYQIPAGPGTVLAGLSFSAYSGVPRNYFGALIPNQSLVLLLPRGSAGRTPTVTQADLKIAYRRPLSKTTSLEAFLDVYNILNQRTATQTDDAYTFDTVSPIENGTATDLKYAKNVFGAPITKNPNFGQPTAYQAPIHGRIGLRFLF